MQSADFIAILPPVVIAVTTIVVMLAIAIRRSHLASAILTLAGLALAFGSLWIAEPRRVTTLLIIDRYALFYMGLIIAAAFATAVLAHAYLERQEGFREEFYLLLLVATLGSAVLAASSHFVSFFLGLELLSVSLYALIAYVHARPLPLEAGLKYLVLAAASAAFLLFGMALLYAELGTMEFDRMAALLPRGGPLVLPGCALLIAGFGFKLAVVPFHWWTPDVYQGAPAPVTAFLATVSKGAVFALLLRYFNGTGAHGYAPLALAFNIIAIASMFAGNLLALMQENVKRILAYSSIAHLGYLLVAFQAGGTLAPQAVTFYLVAYFITTLGAFGVVSALSEQGRDADALSNYRGLFWRRPALATIFAAMLFSLAGIPLTAGFFGKFYIVAAGASARIWTLVLILVITSGIGLFYYLRVVFALFAPPESTATIRISATEGALLAILAALLIWFGVYPDPLLQWIRTAVA